MTPNGPLPLIPGRGPALPLIIHSGPLTLDIRPLSCYQQTLIDTITRLKSDCWSDKQIAAHLNTLGWLSPRGHRFSPAHVWSIRNKYEKRIERLGEK